MLSVKLMVWLRVTEADPSVRPEKFVNERLGGPKLMGSWEVPAIPSCAAMSLLYAKKGAPLLLLRLNVKLALLLNLRPKLWLQPKAALKPVPVEVSRNPKSCCEAELRLWNWMLNVSRSLFVSGALRRTPRCWLSLGVEEDSE